MDPEMGGSPGDAACLITSMEVRLSEMIIYYNGFATTIAGRDFRRAVLIEPKLELPEDTVGLKLLYEGAT